MNCFTDIVYRQWRFEKCSSNSLMIHVMNSNDFDPANPADLDYIWDLRYSLQWTDDTKKLFVKDIKQLLDSQSCGVNISDPSDIEILKKIFKTWRDMALAKKPTTSNIKNSILRDRYIKKHSITNVIC